MTLAGRQRMTPQIIANLDARVASTASRRLDPALQQSLDKLEQFFTARDRAANGRLSQAEFDAAIREAAPSLGTELLGKVAGVAVAVGVRPGAYATGVRRPPIIYYDFMQLLAQHLLDEGYSGAASPAAAQHAPAQYGAVRVTPGASWQELTGSALDVEPQPEASEAAPNPLHSLHGQGLAAHVLAALREQKQMFEAAVHILDPKGSGTILRADFRKICDHMVFQLSDSQFETLVRHMGSGTRLHYEGMLEDDAFSMSQADRAWKSLAGKVTAKLFEDGAALHKMMKRVDRQRTGTVSRKLFYSTFERWMGHYIPRTHFDRIARSVVIRRDPSHPRYTKEDKLIAYEVLFDLFDQASDAVGGGIPAPDWLTHARRPAFLGTTTGGIAEDAGAGHGPPPPPPQQQQHQNRWVPDPAPTPAPAQTPRPIQMPTVAMDDLDFEGGYDNGSAAAASEYGGNGAGEGGGGGGASEGAGPPAQHNPHERSRPNFFGHQVNEGTTGIPKGRDRLEGSLVMEIDTHRKVPLNAGASGGHYNPGNAKEHSTTKWGGLYLTGKHDGEGEGGTAQIEDSGPATIPQPFLQNKDLYASTGPSYRPKVLESWQQSEVGLNLGLRPPHAKEAQRATIPVALGGTFVAEDPKPETRTAKEILLTAGMPVVDDPRAAEPAVTIVQTLTAAVTAKYDAILAEFHRRDYRRTGYLTRNDVVRVVQNICKFEVSKVAESKIFHTIDQNQTGVDIKYQEFMLKYGGELPRNRTAPAPRPKTQARPSTRNLRKTSTAAAAASTTVKNGGTGSVSLSATALLAPSLAQMIVRNWVPLKAMFRQRDWQCEGVVEKRDFGQCLADVGVKLDTDELKALAGRWAASGGRKGVAYVDFLRHYVKSSSAKAKSDKQKLTYRTTKKALETQRTMRPDADTAFRAIEKAVLPKWTAIRRSCLKHDPKPSSGKPRSGSIKPSAFKKVLKEHGIVLTEEQFYHIHSHVDAKLATGVKYDGFFKEILGRAKQK